MALGLFLSIKFYWHTATPTHFYITYSAFTTRAELSCPHKDRPAQKAELIYSLALCSLVQRSESRGGGPGGVEAMGRLQRQPLPGRLRTQDGDCWKD